MPRGKKIGLCFDFSVLTAHRDPNRLETAFESPGVPAAHLGAGPDHSVLSLVLPPAPSTLFGGFYFVSSCQHLLPGKVGLNAPIPAGLWRLLAARPGRDLVIMREVTPATSAPALVCPSENSTFCCQAEGNIFS